jgi:hypothetical protein
MLYLVDYCRIMGCKPLDEFNELLPVQRPKAIAQRWDRCAFAPSLKYGEQGCGDMLAPAPLMIRARAFYF